MHNLLGLERTARVYLAAAIAERYKLGMGGASNTYYDLPEKALRTLTAFEEQYREAHDETRNEQQPSGRHGDDSPESADD